MVVSGSRVVLAALCMLSVVTLGFSLDFHQSHEARFTSLCIHVSVSSEYTLSQP